MTARGRLAAASRRLVQSALGATVLGLVAAVLDASWAKAAGGEAARKAGLSLFLSDAGLLAPIALAVGLSAGVAGLVIDPTFAPSPSRLVAALRVRAIGRPADIAAFVPLTVLCGFLWMTLSAHLTRALLAVDVGPPLAGVAIAASTIGLGVLAGLAVLAFTPPLRHALATASEGMPASVDPAVTGGAAVLAVTALFAFGVATGTISGEGGLFGIYGIFKRPELDLRAPFELLAMGAGGLFAPAAVQRIRTSIALPLALAPLALLLRAAVALNGAPAQVQAIERGAPLGHPALSAARRLTDRDHDGYSPYFGGGDCDDTNPNINPGATEIPDNGIDEDCSGSDLHLPPPPVKTAAPPPAPRTAEQKPRIPADLNLVLVTIDTLRADVGFGGYARPITPNLDKLAAKSIVFEHAYSLASYTGKSVGPLLIGKYGSETHRNWGHSNFFTREDTIVSERLKRAGFHTMSVQAMRYFGIQSGLNRGFDVVDMSAAPAEGLIKDMETSVTGDRVTEAALKLLAKPESTSGRFFLWVHYLDCHADYLPHEDGPKLGTSQRDLYDGEIAFVDKQLQRVLDVIAAAPWGARTAIIVTSDHGEAFGEHPKMWRHGGELWEELVHVPLLVYVPGVAPARVAARRSAIDLVPTILELLGVPAPSAEKGNDFVSGVSFVPDLFLAGAAAEPRDVLVDMPAGPNNDPRRSLIHGDLKLTVSNDASYELYDLAKDPEEKENLYGTDPQAKPMLELYAATKARLREVRVTDDRK